MVCADAVYQDTSGFYHQSIQNVIDVTLDFILKLMFRQVPLVEFWCTLSNIRII